MTGLRTAPADDGELFTERIRQYARGRPQQRLAILLAGCGWNGGPDLGALGLDHLTVHITGVDLDTPDLRAHTQARGDLDTWHLGDLRTVPLPPRAYDVVCAPYLIERLDHTELVLDRIIAALKPGGLLLVRFRDRDTAFGFADRLIPAQIRRALCDDPDAVPPPAVYEKVASLRGMHWYCGMRGLLIAEEYPQRPVSAEGNRRSPAGGLARIVSGLSCGRLTADHSEMSLVIRKPENRFARVI